MAIDSGAEPIIVLTKLDEVDEADAALELVDAIAGSVPTIGMSMLVNGPRPSIGASALPIAA